MKNTRLEKWILIISVTALIVFGLFKAAESQTVQELDTRLKRVEDSLGINYVPVPIDTAISFPVYQGIILSGNYDIYPSPYSAMYYDRDGLYKIFIQKAGLPYAVGSVNGTNNWIYSSAGNMPRGTVMKIGNNIWAALYHKWYNNLSYYYTAKSINAYNWNDTYLDRVPHGEDVTFIQDGDIYRIYGRVAVPPAVRTIGYMETNSSLSNFTNMIEILRPDVLDGLDQFYSMTVVKGLSGYFGFLNVFNTGTDLVSVQLVWSENGEDNWQRLINRQEILQKKNGVQCLYACAGVINNEVYITTISAKFNHSENNRNGQYYYCELYKISLTNLQSNLK